MQVGGGGLTGRPAFDALGCGPQARAGTWREGQLQMLRMAQCSTPSDMLISLGIGSAALALFSGLATATYACMPAQRLTRSPDRLNVLACLPACSDWAVHQPGAVGRGGCRGGAGRPCQAATVGRSVRLRCLVPAAESWLLNSSALPTLPAPLPGWMVTNWRRQPACSEGGLSLVEGEGEGGAKLHPRGSDCFQPELMIRPGQACTIMQ